MLGNQFTRLCLIPLAAACFASAAMAEEVSPDASFTWLGHLGGEPPYSVATALSADGGVVAGFSTFEIETRGKHAFRWTRSTGVMQDIGELPGGVVTAGCTDTSANGDVIVGYSSAGENEGYAFRWTEATGMVSLGDLPGGRAASAATAVSADGNVVVGGASVPFLNHEAFMWTASTGMVGLGWWPGASIGFSGAVDCSDDGSVIVGGAEPDDSYGEINVIPVVWRDGVMMEFLDFEADLDGFDAGAGYVSGDGEWILGVALFLNEEETEIRQAPFRWSEDTGMLRFEPEIQKVEGISRDGTFLLVLFDDGVRRGPAIWDEVNGSRLIWDILVDNYGVELPDARIINGIVLLTPWAMSRDGRCVCGFGTHDTGVTEAFHACLPRPGDLRGDVNGDGLVTAADRIPMQVCMDRAEIPARGVCAMAADLDGDEDVDADDAALLEGLIVYVCDVAALLGTTCYGDTDGNGLVSPADRGFISANFGEGGDDALCLYDLDGNGVITPSDRGFVSANVGVCAPLPDFQNGSGLNDGQPDLRFSHER